MTPGQLAAARERTLADVIGPDLRVLFCGINPGLMSAWTGYHFARPGNRFWPALHASGFTARRFAPAEQGRMPELGLGITNVAGRATARADELTAAELRAGGQLLSAKVTAYRPRWLAVLGVTAYRVAFDDRAARVGPQERTVGDTRIWVLPSPSGLNAHWSPAALGAEFGRLREAVQELPAS
ncbi:G/U mismatch-specific DNA glycosylase [Actinacidiphila sp. ITFR-21]|uniref:G/U mismatch-specific DNA glycosylase n=1 Tax=Actinacidiphila sp. ITFR-21 TaxID=3075199 RepID=UPI0028899364|nr:G/U mismatch-specific DNA glycosylase [Streptomyces sp. ITFR-21]WNI19492.1 G/U mismatch-specific DNA glycosylase [Streptomyces sp. ITFR-21]